MVYVSEFIDPSIMRMIADDFVKRPMCAAACAAVAA
jgi:hypothetical protein